MIPGIEISEIMTYVFYGIGLQPTLKFVVVHGKSRRQKTKAVGIIISREYMGEISVAFINIREENLKFTQQLKWRSKKFPSF
jgi:hypothetical protein